MFRCNNLKFEGFVKVPIATIHNFYIEVIKRQTEAHTTSVSFVNLISDS